MTLKGSTKMDLIFRSRPVSSDGAGRPSLDTHVDSGHGFPAVLRVWKSFWTRERDEKQIRTRILLLGPLESAQDESLRRMELRVSSDLERAQKQVAIVRECWVERRVDV